MEERRHIIVKTIVEKINTIKNKVVCSAEDINEPLTGKKIGFGARDLVYLMLELMEEYNIGFEAHEVENYKFNTIEAISNTVLSKIVP